MTRDPSPIRVRVRAICWEAAGVVSLHLERPDLADLPGWEPGAHIDLHLPSGAVRQYSLSGSPAELERWRITVLEDADGRGGSVEAHGLRPGTELDVVGPRNDFALVQAHRYRFIAGGIGITPLLAMIAQVATSGAPWSLLYGGRSRKSMAFADQLVEDYGEAVRLRPEDEAGLLDLGRALADPMPGEVVYCCGPEPLIQAVTVAMESGWPADALYVERFAAVPDREALAGDGFEVVLQRSGRSIPVPGGCSILEALEAAGITGLPSSCLQGICGTCETTVIDGVPDHHDSLLSEEEREAGKTMMICVGRAKSARIVLDL